MAMASDREIRAVSVETMAKMIDIGRTSAYELVRTGRVNSVRVGRRLLIPLTAIDEFLAGRAQVDSHQREE